MTGRGVRRNWSEVELASHCLVCGRNGELQRAHLIGRARDPRSGRTAKVLANEIVTLCRSCHMAYDAHRLDLYPFLDRGSLLGALRAAGSPGEACRRLSGRAWREMPGDIIDARLARLEELDL